MKERSITADVFYVLTIMGTAWFMFWAFPGLWVWTTMAICQWMSRLFPHFKELMVFCHILACLFPIPCCLAGYFLMRRNKEEIRYPGRHSFFGGISRSSYFLGHSSSGEPSPTNFHFNGRLKNRHPAGPKSAGEMKGDFPCFAIPT